MNRTGAGQQGNSSPEVSVVVLSYNRPEYTDATLQALTTIPSGVAHELIVVDNGSDEPTLEMLQAWKSRGVIDKLLLLPDNLGTSPGFNKGFELADSGSRFLTKLDNDIEVLTPNWLASIIAVFNEVEEAGIVATDIVNHHGLQGLDVITLPSGRTVKDWAGWRAGGGGMTFRRASYENYGGFSEDFPADLKLMPDDYEYYHRLKKVGLKAYYACAAQSRMQSGLNKQYSDYYSPKKRQYHLLRTRFFKASSGVRKNYLPYIVDTNVSTSEESDETCLSVEVTLNCSEPGTVGLGMTLTYAADGKHLYDGNNDIMVELSPGVVECARKFQFPEGARKGDYQLAINLCEGQPGKTPLVDRYVMTTMVTL